ncbi:hypothetical protein DRP07_06270 [Archaeoglobales archaeon]|nr:MAG: hypothetical protein DRP07_06270 [Archaeoglobales archaeon]
MKLDYQQFEEELRSVLNDNFKERLVNLKKTGNIFSPMFYLVFTRLVELSSIMNDVVLPNEFELIEMFRTRKEFLQLDYNTINETVRRIWFFETKRDKEYGSSKSMEDFLYIIYRMKDIQERIDRVILNNIREWKKDELAKLYFLMIKVFLEIDEEVNEIVNRSMRYEFARMLILNVFPSEKREKIGDLLDQIFLKSQTDLKTAFKSFLEERFEDEKMATLGAYLKELSPIERQAIAKVIESLMIYIE